MMVSLTGRLLACSAALIPIAALIMAAKVLLKRHLSMSAQYRLWFPFLFILAVPFFRFTWINSIC